MIRKLTYVVVAGAGYVLGARAGKERYTQIEAKARQLANKPAVKSAADTVLTKAEDAKTSAVASAQDAKQTLNDKVESTVGQGSGDTPDVEQKNAGTTPMAGAAPSGSAPDTA